MNLNANKSRLTGLTKDISLRWTEARNFWRDAKCEEFDRRFMRELFPQVNKAVNAIEKLDELFRKIAQDCE